MDDRMQPYGQNLADLIGSRLCHDLSNPLGAVGNGVELLEMTRSAEGPELELIRDAIADALARVRFFRLAFGQAGPDHTTSAREARTTLEDLYRRSRIHVDWKPAKDLPRQQVKLAFLMMLCTESALPMGGDVTISMECAGGWSLRAQAGRITLDDDAWSVLRFGQSGAARLLRPSEAQFIALQQTAESMDLTVHYVQEDGLLRLSTF